MFAFLGMDAFLGMLGVAIGWVVFAFLGMDAFL